MVNNAPSQHVSSTLHNEPDNKTKPHLLELRRQREGLPLALLVARGELPLVEILGSRRRTRRARDGVVVHAMIVVVVQGGLCGGCWVS